ncbi:MAG: LysR family transcriptional regulator [Burkholderiaceae bacterium]|nr:LysR family transcriptional regulator [Burkholderiaceae bacterium]
MQRKTASLEDPAPAPADMHAFVRAVELGTLSAAARERDVPASQVSRAIDRLEAAYGVRLLRRSTHGLSVTPEGEILLGHARQILGSLTDLSAEFESRSGSPSGVVRMSVSEIMADAQVLPSLAALAQRHPQLRVDLHADDRLIDLATEGFDLAIRTSVVDNDNLVARRIGEYRRAVYASPGFLHEFGAPRHPEDLARMRCVTHASRGQLNRWGFLIDGRRTQIAVNGHHRSNNTALAAKMVREGLGVGRLNSAAVCDWVSRGELVPVLTEYQDPTLFPIYAVMLPERRRLPRVRAVVEHLAGVFGPRRKQKDMR